MDNDAGDDDIAKVACALAEASGTGIAITTASKHVCRLGNYPSGNIPRFSRAYVSLGTICRRIRDAGTKSFDKFPRQARILNLGCGKRKKRFREMMLARIDEKH